MVDVPKARNRTPADPKMPAHSILSVRSVLVLLAGAAGLFLAWTAVDALLLIFAGVLFAALLDACTRGLSWLVPLGRTWVLAIVCSALAFVVGGLFLWTGFSFASQVNALVHSLSIELQSLQGQIADLLMMPQDSTGAGETADLSRLLFPNPRQLFGEARGAFIAALGVIGNVVVVTLIGIFIAASPSTYRRGILDVLPPRHRLQAGDMLDEIAYFLRRWLVGQLAAMALLAVLTWAILVATGVPSPLLLGVQAGLFNFVPYVGAIIGGAPILLMALPLGVTTTLVTLALFTVVHVGIGYVVMPLIQKQAVHLPPALTLASVTLFAVLFGAASVALATPLVAALRLAIIRMHDDGGMAPAD